MRNMMVIIALDIGDRLLWEHETYRFNYLVIR
jgi:hypothetical protein